MAEQLSELEQQARALSPDDRARLAEVLLESLQGPPRSRSKPLGVERSRSVSPLTIAGKYKLIQLRTFSPRRGAILGETSAFCCASARGVSR